MVLKPEMFGLGDSLNAMRWSFATVAVWWAVFSVPLFLRVSEPPGSAEPQDGNASGGGVWSGLRTTFADLKSFDQALLLLFAFLIYNDGIGTIIRMTGIYGKEVGIDQGTLIKAILVVQFLGIPCTFLFAGLASKIGSKPTIGITLLIYTVVTWVAYTMETATQFWLLALLVASAQGGCQALSRSLFASMIPERKSSQFFAFFAVAEKFAGVFGAGIFAILVNATGESRQAVLSLVVFFIIGGLLLSRLDVEKGRRQAEEANRVDQDARAVRSSTEAPVGEDRGPA
jgi:UMF1 family MFS transporter